MNRLECIGRTSKSPPKITEPVKTEMVASRSSTKGGEVVNKSGHPKGMPHQSQSSTQSEVKTTSVGAERRQTKGKINRSRAHGMLQSPSPADVAVHGDGHEKTLKTPPVGKDENAMSAGNPEREQKLDSQASPNVELPQRSGSPHTSESGSGGEGEEEEEAQEEEGATEEFRAPIELLAEFLKAVMGTDYTLAKKLCQMILIYEPENAEAKHFLPLIEERLQIEATQKNSSNEDNTSDDNERESSDEDESDDDDDDDEGDEDDGDDDDDDDDSSSSDSDDDSSSSSSDGGD